MNEGNKSKEPNDKCLIFTQLSVLAKKLKKTTQAHKNQTQQREKDFKLKKKKKKVHCSFKNKKKSMF